MESCPSGRRCSTRNAVYVMYLGFESLTLRQSKKQVVRPAFAFAKQKGIRTRREQTCLRKKTVLWTVFADAVKEQSDAKAYGTFFIPSVVKDDTSPCNKGRLR